MGCMSVSVIRRDAMAVSVGLVCDVNIYHYLAVSPDEVLWIAPGAPVTYEVTCDTKWRVV